MHLEGVFDENWLLSKELLKAYIIQDYYFWNFFYDIIILCNLSKKISIYKLKMDQEL